MTIKLASALSARTPRFLKAFFAAVKPFDSYDFWNLKSQKILPLLRQDFFVCLYSISELFGLSLRALLHPEDEVFRAVSLALGFVMAQLPNGFKINALDAVTVL